MVRNKTLLLALFLSVQVFAIIGPFPGSSSSGGGGSGTVTSVGLSDSSSTPIFTISGSPVSTSGTLTETLSNQSANTLFCGPTSGGAAQPTFKTLSTLGLINTLSSLDGTVPSAANGAVINGSSLYLQSASSSVPGLVNTGTQTLAGNKSFSGTVTLNGTQTATNDAATIGYVNTTASGLDIEPACVAATTTTLNATYTDILAGPGATLANAGTLAAFSVDGQSPAINSRILVKNQTSTFQNGIYTLTTVGSGAIAWVLTRATNYDQAPSEISPGDLVVVNTGTTNALTSWLQTATVTTVGTDPILFSQFTNGNAAGSSLAIGSATATRHTMYQSATASTVVLKNSAWADGSNGELQYTNYASNKGTVVSPLININPNSGGNDSGFFSDASGTGFILVGVLQTAVGGWTNTKFFPPGSATVTNASTNALITGGTATLGLYAGGASSGSVTQYTQAGTTIASAGWQSSPVGRAFNVNGEFACGYSLQAGATYTSPLTECTIVMSNVGARTLTLPDANNGVIGSGVMRFIIDGAGTAATTGSSIRIITTAVSKTINGTNESYVNQNYGWTQCVAVASNWLCHGF